MAYTTINKSTDYFNTKLYTGDGTSSNAITGVGFQPDWLWIKNRTDNGTSHVLTDSLTFSDRRKSDTNGADETNNRVGSYDSDGFTLNSSSSQVNASSKNYAAWNWLANGSGSANTDGTISSTVSANTTAGFSIVTYTGNATSGATIGHGLGAVPKMYMVKRRDTTGRWQVYHVGLDSSSPEDKYIFLDGTETVQDATNRWNDTAPTSSVFSLGNSTEVNASGGTYVAYCFAEKTGYSKFGKYTGNNNASGPFIYTGFKPAFVMLKSITAGNAQNWYMYDNKRDGYNGSTDGYMLRPLWASSSNSEASVGNYKFDIYSNGFKIRETGNQTNGASNEYLYMAFGQSLVGSNNVPCTAF